MAQFSFQLPEFLRWRYELYCSEYIDLFGSVGFFCSYLTGFFKKVDYDYAYVFANKRNIGDYISHLGCREIIKQPGPFILCSPVGRFFYIRHLQKIKKYNPNCHLIIGGGGLLQGVFADFWEHLLSSGLSYSLVGIGLNRMVGRKELPEHILKQIVSSAETVSVRDTLTYEQIHMLHPTTLINICPSVNYLQNIRIQSTIKPILLHMVHPSDLRLAGIDLNALQEQLKDIAKSLDLDYVEFTNMGSDHLKGITLVAQSAVIVTSRLHGAIMSFALGRPFVPLLCDEKIASFLSTHTETEGLAAEGLSNLESRVSMALNQQVDKVTAQQLESNIELGRLLQANHLNQ